MNKSAGVHTLEFTYLPTYLPATQPTCLVHFSPCLNSNSFALPFQSVRAEAILRFSGSRSRESRRKCAPQPEMDVSFPNVKMILPTARRLFILLMAS
jgi:hypothetical protein